MTPTGAERAQGHRDSLRALDDWEPYLLAHSGLPGPRANLVLLEVVGDEAHADRLRALASSEDEFLAACGAAGLGRLVLEGDPAALPRLRALADDPRWRVREGVAMALQRIGDRDPGRLLEIVHAWTAGSPLQRRAAAAGLCEPRLLRDAVVAEAAIEALEAVTGTLVAEPRPRSADARVLRQALGYCWSVAVVAAPGRGKQAFERLAAAADPDLRWIVRQNLRKDRLRRLDAAWVAALQSESQHVTPRSE